MKLQTKKNLLWAVMPVMMLMLTTLSGCGEKPTHEEWQQEYDKYCSQRISKFNYEGHRYIIFSSGKDGNRSLGGITHDENCECRRLHSNPYDINIAQTDSSNHNP